jgi:hypothetical protein
MQLLSSINMDSSEPLWDDNQFVCPLEEQEIEEVEAMQPEKPKG